MPFQPLIEEPSNILPSSNRLASMIDLGKVTWCCATHVGEAQIDEIRSCGPDQFSTFSNDTGNSEKGMNRCQFLLQSACQLPTN